MGMEIMTNKNSWELDRSMFSGSYEATVTFTEEGKEFINNLQRVRKEMEEFLKRNIVHFGVYK